MKLLTALLLFFLVLCSCAHMTVNVSILDRKYWSSPEQMSNSISEQIAKMAMKRGNGDFTKVRESMKLEVTKAADNFYEDLRKKNIIAKNPVIKETIANNLKLAVDTAFNKADQSFKIAFEKFGEASAKSPKDRLAILYEAQSNLDQGYQEILNAQEKISIELNQELIQGYSIRNSQPEMAKQVESKTKAALSGLIGDRGILEDPLASSVVYAPGSYWTRPESPAGINETYASGQFGNTDIAVKMEAVGSFTIKGVRLDASKITQATFAVGRQAIKTVAALYGIPTPTGETKTQTPGSETSFSETPIGFEPPDRRRAAADEALLGRRLARLTLLETILIQRKTLTDPNVPEAARMASIQTVKDIYKSNRSEIDIPTSSKK